MICVNRPVVRREAWIAWLRCCSQTYGLLEAGLSRQTSELRRLSNPNICSSRLCPPIWWGPSAPKQNSCKKNLCRPAVTLLCVSAAHFPHRSQNTCLLLLQEAPGGKRPVQNHSTQQQKRWEEELRKERGEKVPFHSKAGLVSFPFSRGFWWQIFNQPYSQI